MKKNFSVFTALLLLFLPVCISNQIKTKTLKPKKATVKPSITVLYPNGGEKWEKGGKYNIQWKSTGIKGKVKIKLKWGRGHGGWYTLTGSTDNDGSFEYTVPESLGHTGNLFKIHVMNSTEFVKDESDGFFRILIPEYLKLVYPNGGEELEQFREYTIRWISRGKVGIVQLWVEKKNGHKYNLIYSATQGKKSYVHDTGSYLWRIGRKPSPGKYKVLIRTVGNKVSDKSDREFDVILPRICLSCGIGLFGESRKTTFYLFAAKQTKSMKFEVFVINCGSQMIMHVPVMWSVLKQPGNLVLVQEEAGFGNVYPGRRYKSWIKFVYQKSKAYPFYGRNKKIWKKGNYSFVFEIDPLNKLGQSEFLQKGKKCRVDFKVE